MYLGIDLGTSGVKAFLMDDRQIRIGSASVEIAVLTPKPGHVEQEPSQWERATDAAMLQLKASYPDQLGAVLGIGLSGHMHGAVLVDASDKVIRPCILWNDTRSHLEASELDGKPVFRRLSGNIVFPGFTAPKLLWVQRNEPENFARVRWVLLPKDYLRLWLSGEHISEMSDSAGTAWLDVGKRAWSSQLLAKTALEVRNMPALVEGTEPAGTLRAALASRWGMASGVVIAGGAGDNAATAIGMGTIGESEAFVSLGTSGVIFAANDGFRPLPQSAVHTFCHALPGKWHQMGVILAAADSLNWLATITATRPAALADEMGDTLQAPGAEVFLPYVSGERTPHNDALIRAAFTGIGKQSDRKALTQAVMEGVAFAFADALSALAKAGTRPSRAFIVGGGSHSRYWLKAVATALDLSLDLPGNGDFGAALGAARLGMIAATGAEPLSVITAPAIAETIEPVAALRPAYGERLAKYRQHYQAIRSVQN